MKKRDRWGDSDSEGEKPKAGKLKDSKSKKKSLKEQSAPETSKSGQITVPTTVDAVASVPTQALHIPLLHGCRSVEAYERLNHIDEGTYGVVFRARDKITGEIFALKQVCSW